MEKPFDLQHEVSWLSVICGLIGIIILAAYIMWVPGDKDPPRLTEDKNVETMHSTPEPLKPEPAELLKLSANPV